MPSTDGYEGITTTAYALWNTPLHGQASILEALNIFFGGLRPSLLRSLASGLRAQMEPDFVGLVELALQIYVSMSLGQLILRGDQVSIEVIETKCRLELIVRSVRGGFGVDLKSLITKSVTCVCEHLLSARTSRKSSKSRSLSAF